MFWYTLRSMENANMEQGGKIDSTEAVAARWDTAYEKAHDTQSETLQETMNVSGKNAEDIENYLAEKGDSISAEEKDFLLVSLEMKHQNSESGDSESNTEHIPGDLSAEQKGAILEEVEKSDLPIEERIKIGNDLIEQAFAKNKEEIRIKQLQEELKGKETLSESDIEEVEGGIKVFKSMAEQYKIDLETTITDLGQEPEGGEHRYRFSDVEAMQKGSLFKQNKKGPYLAMLGAMALYSGIDLSEPLSVREIIGKIESKIEESKKLETV